MQAKLAEGALDEFTWYPQDATDAPGASQDHNPEQSTALIPIERLQAAQFAIQTVQEERDRAIDTAQAQAEEIKDLRQALGRAEGELIAVKATQRKPPGWWIRLFGGAA